MEKKCTQCGHIMYLSLRKVVYMNETEINDVPVYNCTECDHNELVDHVKEELKQFLLQVVSAEGAGVFSFANHSVFTRVMLQISRQTEQKPVDDLLDLYLLARSLNDTIWMDEIKHEWLLRANCE
jgi:hypothetical protein